MQNRNKMVVLIVIREVDSVNSVGPDSAVKGLSLSGLIFFLHPLLNKWTQTHTSQL